jgi:hypothetical protein
MHRTGIPKVDAEDQIAIRGLWSASKVNVDLRGIRHSFRLLRFRRLHKIEGSASRRLCIIEV